MEDMGGDRFMEDARSVAKECYDVKDFILIHTARALLDEQFYNLS